MANGVLPDVGIPEFEVPEKGVSPRGGFRDDEGAEAMK